MMRADLLTELVADVGAVAQKLVGGGSRAEAGGSGWLVQYTQYTRSCLSGSECRGVQQQQLLQRRWLLRLVWRGGLANYPDVA